MQVLNERLDGLYGRSYRVQVTFHPLNLGLVKVVDARHVRRRVDAPHRGVGRAGCIQQGVPADVIVAVHVVVIADPLLGHGPHQAESAMLVFNIESRSDLGHARETRPKPAVRGHLFQPAHDVWLVASPPTRD